MKVKEYELRKKNFRPFPKVAKAKAAGETEDVVEEEDDSEEGSPAGNVSDFDYLLGMAIWSLTKEKASHMFAACPSRETDRCSEFRSRSSGSKAGTRNRSCSSS